MFIYKIYSSIRYLIMIVFIHMKQYILSIKENLMCQDLIIK